MVLYFKQLKRIVKLQNSVSCWVLFTFDPKLSIPTNPKTAIESEPFASSNSKTLCLFVYFLRLLMILFNTRISESVSIFPLHLPHPGHQNPCLFSLSKLRSSCCFPHLVQVIAQENRISYLNLERKSSWESALSHLLHIKLYFPAHTSSKYLPM